MITLRILIVLNTQYTNYTNYDQVSHQSVMKRSLKQTYEIKPQFIQFSDYQSNRQTFYTLTT